MAHDSAAEVVREMGEFADENHSFWCEGLSVDKLRNWVRVLRGGMRECGHCCATCAKRNAWMCSHNHGIKHCCYEYVKDTKVQ